MGISAWRILAGMMVFSAAGLPAATRPQEPVDAGGRSSVASQRAVLDKYCVTCHNDRAKTAGLTLNTLDMDNMAKDGAVWEKVIQKLRTRFMPPVGSPRPDEATYDALVSHLQASLDAAAAAKPN